jgi:hypothetical protein
MEKQGDIKPSYYLRSLHPTILLTMRSFLFFLLLAGLGACTTHDGPPFPYVQPAPDPIPGLVIENEACITTARVIRADCGELYLRVKNGDRIYSEVYPGDFHLVESQQLQIGYEAADDPQGNTCMQAAGVAFARVICIRKEL